MPVTTTRTLPAAILREVQKAVIGKDLVLTKVLLAFLAGGHVLMEDMPGVGKTTLAMAFSKALGLNCRRVQFTPDVLPSDLTGFSVYEKNTGTFVFQPGALFCHLLLADEINRTSSKTQAALLEAMEESNVTVEGKTYALPRPHLVIATQRPSADVITGLMKANIPSRIAFAVASSLESRIILDTTGAEKLVGKGDMLYAPLGEGKPTRVQGCFISPEEIEAVVAYVKETGEANYSQEVIAQIEQSVQEKDNKGTKGAGSAADAEESDEDELLPAAVDVVLETGQASVSMLQRRLKLGYSRAARLVDQMEDRGIVGPFEGSKPRQLLITRAQWDEMRLGGAPAGTEETPPFDTEE